MSTRGTVVYVAGASDRAATVADHVGRIERSLAAEGMAFDVVPADWGTAVGPILDRIGLAIPDAPSTSVEASTDRSALRRLVDRDPLADLAALAASPQAASFASLADPPAMRDADRLLAIAQSWRELEPAEGPLADASHAAARMVEASPEYQRMRAAPVGELELVTHTARAVAASGAAQLALQGAGAIDAVPGVALAQSIEVRLAETVMAIAAGTLLFGYLGVDVGPGLRRWATDVLVPHRERLMRDGFLGPADVLVFQRAGGAMRRFVSDVVERAVGAGGPVIALGNSLGGIILFEALREAGTPRPTLFVTVGSQAPLLETIGALDGTADPFQPWLNIYDRRDFLAFIAQPVWPDQSGITDVAVDMGVGFPDSHGAAYLSEPQVYRAIRSHPALAGSADQAGAY